MTARILKGSSGMTKMGVMFQVFQVGANNNATFTRTILSKLR